LEIDTAVATVIDSEAFHREKRPQCIFLRTLNRSKTFYNTRVFRFEKERLDTFIDWPLSLWISPEDLAAAGFYYLRNKDLYACYFCGGVIGDWEKDDTPLGEHCRLFRHCPFVRNQPTANINLGQSCILDQIIPIPETKKKETSPYSCRYITLEARLQSFQTERRLKDWPLEIQQQRLTICDLAKADFYYFGFLDMVRCFSCGVGLHNWEENEEPWNVHARWSSSCEFLLLNKEADFIKKVQDQTPPYKQSNSAVKPQKIYRVNLSDDDMTYLMNQSSIIKVVINMGYPSDNLEIDTAAAAVIDSEAFHREKRPQCIFLRTLNRSKTFYNSRIFAFEKERLDTFVDWPLSSWISPEDLAAAETKKKETTPYSCRCNTFEARMQSFQTERRLKDWPLEIQQQRLTICDLAKAGFYYFGFFDMVRCFSCGVGLHNWEKNEEPWNVHARWSSSCEFLLLNTEADFIKKVQDQTPPYKQMQPNQPQPNHQSSPEIAQPNHQSSPEIAQPNQSSPEIAQPNQSSPEIAQPNQSSPEIAQPNQSSPEIEQPNQSSPEIAQPNQSSPEIAQPNQSSPEIAQPNQSSPEIAQPNQSSPEIAQPNQSSPEIAQP
ncbi:death-associated inhibitor of apoptosis 2-like 3, partial [Homarus americanus]